MKWPVVHQDCGVSAPVIPAPHSQFLVKGSGRIRVKAGSLINVQPGLLSSPCRNSIAWASENIYPLNCCYQSLCLFLS